MKSITKSGFVLAAFAASVVVGHGAAIAASAENGHEVFLQHGCWQCHGERGQGGVDRDPGSRPTRIRSKPVDLRRTTNRNCRRSARPFAG